MYFTQVMRLVRLTLFTAAATRNLFSSPLLLPSSYVTHSPVYFLLVLFFSYEGPPIQGSKKPADEKETPVHCAGFMRE